MTLTSGETSREIDIPRSDLILVALLGFACLVLYVWLVSPPPPVGFYWDDGWYLMMAEWLSGRGEHRELVWNMLHLRQYPPFYPAVLALLGATLDHPGVGFLVNAVAGTAAAVCLYLWARQSEEFPMPVAAIAAVAMVLCPTAFTWLPALFSEHLFIFETVVALWLAAVVRKPPGWVVLGLVLGIAVMTRTAGLALLGAVLVSALPARWRMLPWLAAGIVVPLLGGWWLSHDLPSVPRYRSIMAEMLQTVQEPGKLGGQFVGIATGWKLMWGSVAGGILALVAVLPGLWARLRRHCADAWLVPITLVMLIVWPYPAQMERLIWPLMPALLICAAETTRSFRPAAVQYAALILIPAVVAVGLQGGMIRSVARAASPPDPDLYSFSRMMEWTRASDRGDASKALQARRQLMEDMQRVRTSTPPRVCIYSELPALLAVQAKRISQTGPWQELSELDSYQLTCDYYYLMPLGLPGSTPEVIRQTAERHELLFESPLPWDPTGDIPMGVLFRLDRK